MDHFIYLIQLREFIENNDKKNIYKIGKTKQPNYKRYSSYANGSVIMLHINCIDCDAAEKTIINIFKQKYIHKHQYGNEYFEGNCQSMIMDIINVVRENKISEVKKTSDVIELSDDICEISKIESDLAKKRSEHNIIPHKINETTKTIFSSDDKILKHVEKKISRVEKINQKTNKLTCNKCGHKFGRQYHLDKHLENKSCKTRNYKCRHCDMMFTTDNSMYRHMKHNCNVKKDNDNKRNMISERLLKLEKENEELREEIKKQKRTRISRTI